MGFPALAALPYLVAQILELLHGPCLHAPSIGYPDALVTDLDDPTRVLLVGRLLLLERRLPTPSSATLDP